MRPALVVLAVMVALTWSASWASAIPSPYPSYNNTQPPVLADGQEHGTEGQEHGTSAPRPVRPIPITAPPAAGNSGCAKARAGLRRARRGIRRIKRKLERARSSARRRALRANLRKWQRKHRRAKRSVRLRCGGTSTAAAVRPRMVVRRQVRARAASHSGAYHRSGLIFCDNGLLYMYAGPDMRSQSPAFVQGVAFRIVLFRWDGSKWAYNNEYPAYWWTTADYHSAPFAYYDENDEQTFRDQGFYINVPGYYRLAVRYHWWPNTSGGVAGSAWHWGGAHRYPSSGVANDYCQYA